jgi:hypothetical protein
VYSARSLPKTSAGKAAKSLEIADRRRRVALMRRLGMEQKAVAEALGVSEATISGDVAAMKEAWAKSAVEDIGEMVAQEQAALDGDEVEFRRLLEGAETAGQKVKVYDTVLSIMRRRAELVGLDSVLRRKQAEMEAGSRGLDALLEEVMREEAP